MATDTQEQMEMGTKPVKEHEWLNNLVGEWNTEHEMTMPDGSTEKGTGWESIKNFHGLWAYAEGQSSMPGGQTMDYRAALGYDVSFKEYRGFWLASVSSHLWKYQGGLSNDGKLLTLDCVGPNMEVDGETANYRDVVELKDEHHYTRTTYGQDEKGEWCPFVKISYSRK